MLFMGVDIGTQGVRAIVIGETGALVAARSVPFQALNAATEPGLYEQRPSDWIDAMEAAIRSCVAQLRDAGYAPDEIARVSIDGTSGTIVPLDKDNRPRTNALMYNDGRAGDEARCVHEALSAQERRLGYTFNRSFSLPRVLWIGRHCPDVYEKTAVFAHQADYAAGILCGAYHVSDYSNALKTGYDLIAGRWPEEIRALGLDMDKLPEIVAPGAVIAPVTKEAAARFGLSEKTCVVGGSTDGYASALAAGAVKTGDWASIIGTTFVLKGVTQSLVVDPNGSSYSHRLPSGEWMLGGASNVGGRCLNDCANGRDFKELDRLAEKIVPTGCRAYPLTGTGERFPFVKPDAEPFYRGNILGETLFPALMEGVGFAERFALAHMEKLGCPVGDVVYAAGGACKSDLWLRIRASILNKRLVVPAIVDAAMGSALLAASGALGGLDKAAKMMIREEKTVAPVQAWTAKYEDIYARFVADMRAIYGVEV